MRILDSLTQHSTGLKKKLFILALATILLPLVTMATHFRYGNVSWTNLSGNTVVFKISQAWRGDAFGAFPAVGAVLDITNGIIESGAFVFGDGTQTDVVITVTSVNAGENWFYGEMTVSHTYASAGTFKASFSQCCRISSLINAPDGNFKAETTVDVGNGNSSPVSSIVPIVDVPVNNPAYHFTVPAVDPNGSPVSFRFSTSDEAGPGFFQPAGLSVNSSGQMEFNTMGTSIGQLYATQVMISDGTSLVPVDFIIRISGVPGTPPFFVYPTTPANGEVFTITAGQTAAFNLRAADDDAGNMVTLSVAGAPIGAIFTPALPASGNPVVSAFSWSTTAANIGTYVLSFNAQDNTLQSASTSVTINVVAACQPPATPTVRAGGPVTFCQGGSVTLTSSAAGSYLWSNGATSQSITVTTGGTYSVTVKNGGACSATSAGTTVVVNNCGGYCPASGSCNTGGYICQVTTCYGVNNASGWNHGYADFTGLAATPAAPGHGFGIAITPAFPPGADNPGVILRVWIDWNNDGDFTDPGELVFCPYAKISVKTKAWIKVPLTATPGRLRMRIAVRQDVQPLSCGKFTYGEVEDYTILVASARPSMPRANQADWEQPEEPGNIFTIYPNPVSDRMIIERSGYDESKAASSMVQMNVTDVKGRVVMQSKLTSLVQAVDMSRLANGIYFVTIKTATTTKTQKIVISH